MTPTPTSVSANASRAMAFLVILAAVSLFVAACADTITSPTRRAPGTPSQSIWSYYEVEPAWVSGAQTDPYDVCWYVYDPEENYLAGNCGSDTFSPPILVGYVEVLAYGDPWDYAEVGFDVVAGADGEGSASLSCNPTETAPGDTIECRLAVVDSFTYGHYLDDVEWVFVPSGPDSLDDGIIGNNGNTSLPATTSQWTFAPFGYTQTGQGKVQVRYKYDGAGPFTLEFPGISSAADSNEWHDSTEVPCDPTSSSDTLCLKRLTHRDSVVIDSAALVFFRDTAQMDTAMSRGCRQLRAWWDSTLAYRVSAERADSMYGNPGVLFRGATRSPTHGAATLGLTIHFDPHVLDSAVSTTNNASRRRAWNKLANNMLHEAAHFYGMIDHPNGLYQGKYTDSVFKYTNVLDRNSCVKLP